MITMSNVSKQCMRCIGFRNLFSLVTDNTTSFKMFQEMENFKINPVQNLILKYYHLYRVLNRKASCRM